MNTFGRIPESIAVGRRISPSFRTLKWLSFAHSAVYFGLIALWLTHSAPGLKTALGWAHGWGWILMCVLCLLALRARVIPLWLAVCVAVIGAVGPFVGSAAFVVEERRRPGARSGGESGGSSSGAGPESGSEPAARIT